MTIRRMKTYTGEQGYVYQYYFVGKRPASGEVPGTEYIFDVTSDRKTTYAVSVILPEKLLGDWAAGTDGSLLMRNSMARSRCGSSRASTRSKI